MFPLHLPMTIMSLSHLELHHDFKIISIITDDLTVIQLQALLEIDNSRDSSISSLNIGVVLGDMTGTLHLSRSHKFYIEFDSFVPKRSSPPCNFIVDAGSEVWLSHDFRVIGRGNVAVQLDGHMSGVYNVTLEDGRKMSLGINSSNSRYIEGKYVQSPPGELIIKTK